MTRPKWSKIYDLLAIVVLGTLTGLALPRMSAIKELCLSVGSFAANIVATRWLFVSQRV
jgi:hypothetical protein